MDVWEWALWSTVRLGNQPHSGRHTVHAVCIDVLEWSKRFNLCLVSKTKQGTFGEKLRADLPILVFIVPDV